MALAKDADDDGRLLWSCPAKLRWLWHLGDRARFFNPRTGSTRSPTLAPPGLNFTKSAGNC
eukprot:380472-Alexandrium_andersonii.AAC.1